MPRMGPVIFVKPGPILLDEQPNPDVGPNDAPLRVTTTWICNTAVHVLKSEHTVACGRVIFHESGGGSMRALLQLGLKNADSADDIFTRLIGDRVEPRHEFIQENALNVANLDV